MQEPIYSPLVKFIRNGLVEQLHFGIVVHVNKSSILHKIGEDNGYKFYHRSCMKPLQSAGIIDLGIDEKYGLTLDEIALCCASHTGDEMHRQRILSVLKKGGFTPDDLLLHPTEPLSKEEKERCIKNNIPFDKLHHNCSGKHAAMLLICKELGFDVSDYKNFNHPLTNFILKKVCDLCEVNINEVAISKDGCGLPVIATTLEQLAKGYLNLFTDGRYEKIKNAFLKYPYLIGGKNRTDSELINNDKDGVIIAKVGACGLCAVVNVKTEECFVVKIADSNMHARDIVVFHAAKYLKGATDLSIAPEDCVYGKEILTADNECIGKIVPFFNFD